MSRRHTTVADLCNLKGKRQPTMPRFYSLEEAEAAETGGIDIASVPPEGMTYSDCRNVAPREKIGT
jgi:3-methyl-2-oxobutanoate hydroxymethyltransferase